MPEEPLLINRNNNVVTLILNRPEKKNSLSLELVEILLKTLEDLAGDDSVRVLVLRGSGDTAFCSGFDILSLPVKHSQNAKDQLKRLNPVETLFNAVINFPWPVIAMINGLAMGAGCELAICCDIRIGVTGARMGMPPAKLGIVYPWRGLKRFVRTVGLNTTREMFLTGRFYQGQRLREMGLLNDLVSADQLESFTNEIAQEIAANAPLAVRGTKRVLNLLSEADAPDHSRMAEADTITETAFFSEDLKEGQLAFMEKRKPVFKGK